MNQLNASESALSDECPGEFGPLIRVKVGVAVRREQLGASLALPRGLLELGSCQDVTRAASKKGCGG